MNMSVFNVTPVILARASSVEDVAEMSAWKESDVFSIAEADLVALLAEVAQEPVHNRIIESMRVADGSPHFTIELKGKVVGAYVLCISSLASVGSLTEKQYAWAEAHPAADIWVVPCVVQHIRADVARAVVDSVYALRERGRWCSEDFARQFLPRPHGLSHYLNGAALLKEHTLVREVANVGTRIYPYVAGVADYKYMLPNHELRCSGGDDFPLMLVQTAGAANGALRVVGHGIYSADNPVNELEIYSVGTDALELLDARGGVYSAACAELAMFPSRLKVGMHLLWSVNLFANDFAFVKEKTIRFEQKNATRTALVSCVQRVRPIQFCGLPGYCLQVPVHAKLPDLLCNVYVFEPLLMGRVPRVGDYISAVGKLQAAPDALVESNVSWADSPETALAAAEDAVPQVEAEQEAPTTPLELLAEAITATGYKLAEPFAPLFRFGRPEFRCFSPEGSLVLVMVDTVVAQHEDKLGYRCRFAPDKYPAHMNRTPQGDGPADVCFVTLHLEPQGDGGFSIKPELHGATLPLTLPHVMRVPVPELITEQTAVELFADCMSTQRFEGILPYLRDDLHYRSETAGIEFYSKMDLLRHLRSCFDTWQKRGVLSEISFTVQKVHYQGASCYCCVAMQADSPVSVTLVKMKNAFIAEIMALSPAQFSDFEVIE